MNNSLVRTAGIGKTKTELKRDLDYLLLAWEDFSRRLKSGVKCRRRICSRQSKLQENI